MDEKKEVGTVKSQRDTTLSILKGIGIILVVMGHCHFPFTGFLFSFHMPLFFMASGYFFKTDYLNQKGNFYWKKVKGVYWPFLKWSVIFLLLHNVFCYFGILNNAYGDAAGVAYSLSQIKDNLLQIVFRMNRYEPMILGTYWFMRSLFVASILVCLCSWGISKIIKKQEVAIVVVGILFCALGGYMTYTRTFFYFIPQSGYREVMATFFIVCGFAFRQYLQRWVNLKVALTALAVLLVGHNLHPTAMAISSRFNDWASLIFTGTSGFIATFYLCRQCANKGNWPAKALAYIGDRSFYIMTFHFLMFKPAMLFKTYIYGLDWHMIGCVPVIPSNDCWYWAVYTLSSLAFSIALGNLCKKIHL